MFFTPVPALGVAARGTFALTRAAASACFACSSAFVILFASTDAYDTASAAAPCSGISTRVTAANIMAAAGRAGCTRIVLVRVGGSLAADILDFICTRHPKHSSLQAMMQYCLRFVDLHPRRRPTTITHRMLKVQSVQCDGICPTSGFRAFIVRPQRHPVCSPPTVWRIRPYGTTCSGRVPWNSEENICDK